MNQESKNLDEKIREFNERAKKEGKAIPEERLRRIFSKNTVSYEAVNFGKRSESKKK